MANLDALRAGGWERLELPPVVERYPTMLTLDERRLLHWLARDVWEGTGAIVDAGSFLGGSTVALATGVRARATPATTAPAPPITTYDLFLVEQYSLDGGYFERWPQLGVDDSFRVAFDALMGDLARETEVHEGDVTAERWSRGPIEILFLDLLKLVEINDVVLPEFLPSLVAGRSVLIQQDYVHGMLPWIQVTMELLADSVEHVVDTGGSRVYAVTRAISAEQLAQLLPLDERVPQARQQQLMEGVVARYGGDRRGTMTLALANLLIHHGELERGAALLDHVERHYADAPEVMVDVQPTRGELAKKGWPAPVSA
ncbi:hypothetical protein Q5424_02750 [Conexibacter sp. JD483]|uniref:hypothetical protein n=1 Tax=unclassified Conexibacter TaxID=2627773 RepID=UPI002728D07C|nr:MULTISPECIES: hypothetical protein [unclassified Conexibacter]MDO8184074.1 hypothetical protein [Conexibacter sp. CPCC 205706]MDO8197066.1 hypothetical protein [Conexibacter sp. CPCC 205762]MDR9367982.1 hypothetical protein [Conexibacter sp. JD483]